MRPAGDVTAAGRRRRRRGRTGRAPLLGQQDELADRCFGDVQPARLRSPVGPGTRLLVPQGEPPPLVAGQRGGGPGGLLGDAALGEQDVQQPGLGGVGAPGAARADPPDPCADLDLRRVDARRAAAVRAGPVRVRADAPAHRARERRDGRQVGQQPVQHRHAVPGLRAGRDRRVGRPRLSGPGDRAAGRRQRQAESGPLGPYAGLVGDRVLGHGAVHLRALLGDAQRVDGLGEVQGGDPALLGGHGDEWEDPADLGAVGGEQDVVGGQYRLRADLGGARPGPQCSAGRDQVREGFTAALRREPEPVRTVAGPYPPPCVLHPPRPVDQSGGDLLRQHRTIMAAAPLRTRPVTKK